MSLVAERLREIETRYGPSAVIQAGSSGSCRGALHNTGRLTDRFLSLFGGFTKLTGSYSSGAEQFVTPYLFGTFYAGTDAENLLDSRLIVLWGANISDTRFGCETENVIAEARKNGTEVVVIDPRRSRTVERISDVWIPLLPGTDTAMMAAVLYVLIEEGLVDYEFVRTYSSGFDEIADYVVGTYDQTRKDPEWAEKLCGVPASTIADFARQYGGLKPAALIPGLSIQRTIAGEEAYRMAVTLQTATGNVGIPGGSSGSNIWGRLPPPGFPAIGRAPGSENAQIAYVPGYRWADAVIEGTAGGYPADIKCMYVAGGNYLCTGSDARKNMRAFEKVEFSVCHELFMTPTASYCDVVFPVTSFLEREDVVFTAGNYVLYSAQAANPVGLSMNDYDVFAELAGRLGFGDEFSGGLTASEWLDSFISGSEVPDAALFKKSGMYIRPDRKRVAFSSFIENPEASPLATPSGRIELSSAGYAKTGFPAFPTYRGYRAPPDRPLYLITPHARYRVNSQNSNLPWFAERQKPVLIMHPKDAARRGIEQGGLVTVTGETGTLQVPVSITEEIMQGVVCLPAGAWLKVSDTGDISGGCANLVTSTTPTMPSQSSRTHSVGVEVHPTA